MRAAIHLEDGSIFPGTIHGAVRSVVGELVFQTKMVGLVESLTDSNYAKQLLAITYPLIGNYGVPATENLEQFGLPTEFESDRIGPAALIVQKMCEDGEDSHWQSVQCLSEWLLKADIPCLSGIHVGQLLKTIGENGSIKAKIEIDSDSPQKFNLGAKHQSNMQRCEQEAIDKMVGDDKMVGEEKKEYNCIIYGCHRKEVQFQEVLDHVFYSHCYILAQNASTIWNVSSKESPELKKSLCMGDVVMMQFRIGVLKCAKRQFEWIQNSGKGPDVAITFKLDSEVLDAKVLETLLKCTYDSVHLMDAAAATVFAFSFAFFSFFLPANLRSAGSKIV